MSTRLILKLMPEVSILYKVFCIKEPIHNTKYIIQNTKPRRFSGFTLIELLIVITIIGILATLILASFGAAQAKARDARRKSDLAQLKRAMEIAKSDCQGSAYYPHLGGSTPKDSYTLLVTYLTNSNLKYMSSITKDPVDSGEHKYAYAGNPSPPENNRCPATDGSGTLTEGGVTDYALWTQLERTSDADATDSRNACSSKPESSTWNNPGYYIVCNN